jgi:hypothetical protein
MTQISTPADQGHKLTQISITCYQPKEGKEEELKALVKEHLPVLHQQQLVTARKAIVMEVKNGTIIEVFEWVSDDAIGKAHNNPAVQALWARFNELSDYVAPSILEECQHIFSGFRAID